MVPIIGVMIGAYIFTRMSELLASKESGIGVKFFAAITMLIALIGTLILLFSGGNAPVLR